MSAEPADMSFRNGSDYAAIAAEADLAAFSDDVPADLEEGGSGHAYVTSRDLSIRVYREAEEAGGLGWANALPEERAAYVIDRIVRIAGTVDSLRKAGYTGADAADRYLVDEAALGRAPSSVDERGNPSVNGRPLAFRSGRELVAEAPADVDYIARPWSALGTITELDGKPKSAGKTTWLLHLIQAILDGRPFLGEPTRRTPVVLLTEQSRASIAPTLRALGLDRDDLSLLTWPDAFGTPWPAMVAAAGAECERIGGLFFAVDTLGQFAGVRGDAENDAGAALEAMAPLQAAAASGLAVLVSRHDRKAGGDVGESGRGSNAWSGAVDCILALRRPLNPARPTIRELEAISRRGDVPAEPVLIELTDAGYVVLGSDAAVAFGDARTGILEILADVDWHTERELVEALPAVSRTTVRDALSVLVTAGVVEKGRRARVTEPYPYRLVAVDGPVDTRPPEPLTLVPSSSPSVDELYTSVNGREETAAPLDLRSEAERIWPDGRWAEGGIA